VIDPERYAAAGFTPAQVDILVERDRVQEATSMQRFTLLQQAINEGFAQQASVLRAMLQSIERRFAAVEQRLDRIEASLRDMQPPERRN
jgi:chaperonin cofactor prefoldin